MAKSKDFIKGLGNILYTNIVQTPFSIARGLSWLHCLPSHANYLSKMEKYGFAEKISPEAPFWEINQEKMDSQSEKKKAFESHYYGKMFHLGEKLMRTKSELELELSVIPQHFVALISGASAGAVYWNAVSEYGAKALIPIAVTTGLSLVHELKFNKKLRNLENKLYKQQEGLNPTTQ